MIEKLISILNTAPAAYVFIGDGEPYYVLNEAGVERRKRIFESEGRTVTIIKVNKGDVHKDTTIDDLKKLADVPEPIQKEIVTTKKRGKS